MRDGNYVCPKLIVKDVLTGVPLMRKGKPYAGLAIVFEGQAKVLGLNATNESMMAVSTGDSQSSKWIGATITLEAREVNSVTGGTEPAIRVMPPNGIKMRSGLAKQLGKRIEAVQQPGKDGK
jgi:hypothetical protein